MKNSIKITDFNFRFTRHGHYEVTYTSPVTNTKFTTITNDMPLIDATKNAYEPRIKDLNSLKRICKF